LPGVGFAAALTLGKIHNITFAPAQGVYVRPHVAPLLVQYADPASGAQLGLPAATASLADRPVASAPRHSEYAHLRRVLG
jgi:hypothetical protein